MTKTSPYKLQVMLQSCCDKYPENIAYSNINKHDLRWISRHAQSVSHFDKWTQTCCNRSGYIMLPNCLQQPIAVFGTSWFVRGQCQPSHPDELSHQLKTVAKTIIVLENMAHVVEKSPFRIEHVIISKSATCIHPLKNMSLTSPLPKTHGSIVSSS